MKKVAMLARTVLWTRVVVNVPDEWDENQTVELTDADAVSDELLTAIADAAAPQLIDRIHNGELIENIDGVWNDTECPYDEIDYVEPSLDEKLAALAEVGQISVDESSFDIDDDRPAVCNGYILGALFRKDGSMLIGIDVNGCLFQLTEDDLSANDRAYVIEEMYAYRIGE